MTIKYTAVFVQGITMKPLVSILDIALAQTAGDDPYALFVEFNRGVRQCLLHLSVIATGCQQHDGRCGVDYWYKRLEPVDG